MKISQTIHSLKKVIQQYKAAGLSIGFVPTMGNLHAGHIELIHQARKKCDKVVVSIFVNPLQFNDANDFDAYPKTLSDDQDKLKSAQCDLLFLPDSEMMYPDGQLQTTKVCVPEITLELEGEHRPGHFDGVSTVVNKLFNLVQPQRAFFGEKDFQQLLLIQKMVMDLNIPIEIRGIATHREDDGLAMSSRNSRLSSEHRKLAPALLQALQQVSDQIKTAGGLINEAEASAISALEKHGFKVEYISVRDASNLKPPTALSKRFRVLAAVWLGSVRLIDNIEIETPLSLFRENKGP